MRPPNRNFWCKVVPISLLPSMTTTATNQDELSDSSIIARKDAQVKIIRSCDRCKEKKIRCNNEIPCNQCIQHNTACTYNMPAKRRRYLYVEDDTSQLVTTDTEARIRQLEEEIINYKLQIRALEKSMTKCLSPVCLTSLLQKIN